MRDISKRITFTAHEHRILRRLSSPSKIQDYLNTLRINMGPKGETVLSPRQVMRERRAHCLEGALCAAVALWYHGETPLLLDLVTTAHDKDHVVALFRRYGRWGAISKTNHAVLRYREPVYASVRELAMSYFHEYFLDNGVKTMRSYSDPFDLSNLGDISWITSDEDLWHIEEVLDRSPHHAIMNRRMIAGLRPADRVERKAGKIVEQKNHATH